MQSTQFRNSIHVYFKKISILFLVIISITHSFAQSDVDMNNLDHDTKPYYFGVTFGVNFSQYKLFHSKYFIQYDSIKEITPLWKPGFNVGIMANARLSGFVDIRTIPSFILREKTMRYRFQNDSLLNTSFESVLFSCPVEFKFKSDRQKNFRFYVAAGVKLDYDFNSNARSRRSDDILKTKAFDYGYNLGLGFEFYFPNFIFSPELKLSNGLSNNLLRNGNTEQTSKAIDKLNTQMIIFSIHLEG